MFEKSYVLGRVTAALLSIALLIGVFSSFPSISAHAVTADAVIVTAPSSSVRARPDSSSAVLFTARQHNSFLYIGELSSTDELWYKIQYTNGNIGWVNAVTCRRAVASSTIVENDTKYLNRVVRVSANSRIYEKPIISSPLVATVSVGDYFLILDSTSGDDGVTWFEIQYGSKLAWIRRTSVSVNNIYPDFPYLNCSNGNVPIIYLSPSRQTDNAYATGNTTEGEQMMLVADKLEDILKSRYNCIVYVADYELKVDKTGRPTDALNKNADIYLAIHSNAAGSAGNGYGTQGYYFPGSSQSKLLAENLIKTITAIDPLPNNVERAVNGMENFGGFGYAEVREPGGFGMVSLLLEVEFHDKPAGASWIINNTDAIATAIADGMDNTFHFAPKSTETTSSTTGTTSPVTSSTDTTSTTASEPSVNIFRLGGDTRISTAVEISRQSRESTENVIIASGTNYPDALAGVPLSKAVNAPILLTLGNELEDEVLEEIRRLGASNVYILGGFDAVSENAEAALQGTNVSSIVRLAGANRFETCLMIADELLKQGEDFDTIFFAGADNFPDALAVSPVAALSGNPILYIPSTGELTEETALYVSQSDVTSAVVLGGTAAVSEEGSASIAALGLSIERISGVDRYETCLMIAERYSSLFTGSAVALATGKSFPDALTGGAHASALGIPVLLADSTSERLSAYIGSRASESIYIYGGQNAVPQSLAQAIIDTLK